MSSPKPEPQKAPKPITAEEFDAMFDRGEDITAYLDFSSMRVFKPGEHEMPDVPPKNGSADSPESESAEL